MNSIRLRHLVDIAPRATKRPAAGTEVTFAPMDALSDGIGGLDTSRTKPFEDAASGSYNFFEDGDVLISKVTPCFENGKKALARNLVNGMGFATSEVYVLRPRTGKIDPRFLIYLLSSENFKAEGIASMTGSGGLRRVSDQAVLNHRPKITDFATQRAVADFLDRETGCIDALIAKKERMASLLAEKRRLNIEEEFKNSGGTPYKLKHLVTIRKGRATATEADDSKDYALVTMDYLRTGNPTHYIDQNTSDVVVAEGDCLVVWDGSNAGEIILARTGILSSTIAKIVPSKRVDRDYLFFALKSAEKILRDSCNGMGIPHVDGSMLKNIIVPLIDLERQKEIAASLMEKTANIDRVIALTRTSIERLKEYRAALITAAVTGQIDVTTYKAGQMTQDTGNADTTDQAATNTD